MVTRTYSSDDSGAPVLTGQVDSFNNLLKAILVDGIGTPPASPWSVAFEDVGAHRAIFRAPAGLRFFLDSDDSGTLASGAREAAMRGFISVTSLTVNSGDFPTTSQRTAGIPVRKSGSADALPRDWRAFVDEKTFYLFINCGDLGTNWDWYGFGDFIDWNPDGLYGALIFGRNLVDSNDHTTAESAACNTSSYYPAPDGIYTAKSYDGALSSQEIGGTYDSVLIGDFEDQIPGSLGQPYPHPVTGGINMCPYRLNHNALTVGRLRGVWVPAHFKPLSQDDTFEATEGTLTRTFAAQDLLDSGQLFIETSATWDSE